jgi:hypothetical protein
MTAEQKKKSKEFLNKVYDKYYGKGKSKTQESKDSTKTPKKLRAGDAPSKGPSRNKLMLKAKAKGIKNFRILNKEELVEILIDGTTKERISEIVSGAVARWKTGWGTSKPKEKK